MAEPDLSQYDPVFQAAGTEWNVDPTLLKAVAAQESGGRTSAVSSKGAQGLMQITPDTQKYLGVTDPNDPVQSIYGAAKYLNEGLDKEGSPEGALLYYHGGPGWRQAYGPESRAYVPGVTAHYVALKPPDQTQDAPAASTPQAPLIIGDSLASKGGLGGTGIVGAQPSAIRAAIAKGDYKGKDVVLSSGASNAPGDMVNVEGQLENLRNGGVGNITLLGVGPGIEAKNPGTNAKLQALAEKYGAAFQPLDPSQMAADGVHPTQQGYRTLLAAATPKVATDATPAPAGSQGQGKAMASSDLPSWLPPAPQASSGTSAAPSAAATSAGNGAANTPAATTPSDTLPSWLPPAPKSSTPTQQEPSWSAYGDATGGDQNLPAWMMQGPAGQTVDEKVRNLLAPAPDTTYGDVLPLARDDKTGEIRLAMPNALRAPLIGLTGGGGWSQSGNITVDPVTGAERLSPEAASVAPFAASPLRTGGPVPEGVIVGGPQVTGVNPLSPEVAARANVRAATAPPEVQAAGPAPTSPVPNAPASPSPVPTASGSQGPQPVGAQATPAAQSGITDAQARAYGSTADKQWLYSSQQPGVTDATEYYPGDTPTMAEREQTTLAARDQKTQRNISPAADQAEREFLHDRSEQRKGIFQQTAGSDATQDAAITEADTNISNGLAQAFRAGGRVDPQPIVDAINAESQTSGGKLPPVKAAMRDVSAALQKDDGSGMETDPQAVYQVRRVINYLQSKEGKVANPGYGSADVQAALTRVKGAIDDAIEPAAPGFRQAIADYSNAQRSIEARELLQAEEPKLYDSRGYMNYLKFHNFMQRVITMRDPRMPPNAAQSLTEEQMNTLKGLHDSLKRSASAEDLAKAKGSDTAPNLMDIARQAVSGVGGDIGAAVIGGLSHGPAGMIIGPMVKRGVGEFLSARGQARAATRMQNLLRPDPTQYPTTPNPLSQSPP